MFKKSLLVILVLAPPITLAVVNHLNHFPRRFAEVEDGSLYRSGFPTGTQVRNLAKTQKIKTVVSLTGEEDRPREDALQSAVDDLKLRHYRFPMRGDGTGDLATLEMAADALAETKDRPILFHCAAGQQRTSTTLGAYWIKHKDMTCYDAIAKLEREYGLSRSDDPQIIEQLKNYTKHVGARMGTPPASLTASSEPTETSDAAAD